MKLGPYVLDSSYRRPRGGRTIIGGSPLRLFRVAGGAVGALEAIERGEEPGTARLARLVERLVDAGAIHPCPDPDVPSCADLTIVLPTRGAVPRFRRQRCRTIVVDDASPTPVSVDSGDVLRLDANRGPGGARNAGLALVDTPFVAFVDSDVDVSEQDLLALLGHLQDPKVGLVAPRVAGPVTGGRLERYEAVRSPLDLGPEAARVAPGTRVSFVPAAVIVCRTDAVREIDGFDDELRYGEDVDLVWRLVERGWRCRYEPTVVARHRTRGTLRAWLEQRVRYGSSAAPLATRHPGALAPVRMSGWSAGAWGAVAAGAPAGGVAVGLATTLALVRKLHDVPPGESLRLAGLGHLYAGRLLASTLLRAWWPVALFAAVTSTRARRALAALAVGLAVADWWRERPQLDPVTYTALRRLDDVAFGTGVWLGAVRHRTAGPLLPSFAPWPPR